MRIVLRTLDEEIVLKKCNSYLDLDKVLTTFHNNEEILARLSLDEDDNEIVVLDNNDNVIGYDPDILRKTIAFYESGKGEEFVSWIYDATTDKHLGNLNSGKLAYYFSGKLLDFTKGANDFDANSISNAEGKRLYKLIRKLKDNLITYNVIPATYEIFRSEIEPDINEYVKRNGAYDYAYMRKFANSLAVDLYYHFGKTDIRVKEVTDQDQETIIKDFEEKIRKHYEEGVKDFEEEMTPYDENGIKNDEKEFLEEFNKKLRL